MIKAITTPASLYSLAQKSWLGRPLGHGLMVMLLCACGFLSWHAQAESLISNKDYSAGLQSYLDGDYVQAQSSWLKSAKAKDAKSMFNLGLLHQYAKLADSDPAKAEKWFRLSGKNGYAAGYYHLATWLKQRGESPQTTQQLLVMAANAGFSPAVTLTGINVSGLSAKQNRLEQATPDESATYNSENYIRSLPSDNWTIQMLAFEERSKVLAFIDKHKLHKQAAYFIQSSDKGALYKLIYGNYKNKDQAEAARNTLPASLMEHGPWLRTVAGVQSVVNAN